MRHSLIALILTLILSGSIFAGQHDATPYGDYSDWCGAYGTCKEDIGPRDAEIAIVKYFSSKGCRVTNIRHKGRFVEAEIHRNSSLADKIIFDRKTGRIRSTY